MRKIYRGLLITLIYSLVALDIWMVRDYFERKSTETHQKIEKIEDNLRKLETNLPKTADLSLALSTLAENVENSEKMGYKAEKLLQKLKNGTLRLDIPKKSAFSTEIDYYIGLRQFSAEIPWAVPLDNYYLSSPYGNRRDPVTKRRAFHRGVDLAANRGSKVRATLGGEVIFAGRKGRYGKMVIIKHKNGFITTYGHLLRIYVKKAQHVVFRQKIGSVGKSGKSTGYHLHYEIKYRNKYKNPYLFFSTGRFLTNG